MCVCGSEKLVVLTEPTGDRLGWGWGRVQSLIRVFFEQHVPLRPVDHLGTGFPEHEWEGG